MSRPATLTTAQRLVAAEVVREGSLAAYRRLTADSGEPHVVRDDLVPAAQLRWQDARSAGTVRPLLALAHITDLQLADIQSPARFEFFNAHWQDPRFAELVPVQRPQEALTAHAVDATLRTINRLECAPVGGLPLGLAVTTGDAIDNAQWNELSAFLTLFDGGLVRSRSGGRDYEGVQATAWPGEVFWRPDGDGPAGPDLFRTAYGFPHLPGVLSRALETFRSPGLGLPWLACYGNHEGLIQGVAAINPRIGEALVDDRKPTALDPRIDADRAFETFVSSPEAFMSGSPRYVTPDLDRRPVSRHEFVEAHFRAGSRPFGHGFSGTNRRDGTAYYAYDAPTHTGPGVRFIALDTTCLAGGADGALDVDQLSWLEDRLREVHSRYRTRAGDEVTTGAADRLVVLFSHHGLDTLTNRRGGALLGAGADGDDLAGARALRELLPRFPNVVAWINGHTHQNAIRARQHPGDPGRGYWEVTTCAIADWPCQTRLVELLDVGDGHLAIACTMLDHASPPTPGTLASPAQLAALHRELAANSPVLGLTSSLEGTATDRNVILLVRNPF